MADKNVTIGIPGTTAVQQAYQDLSDGTYAPTVTGPSVALPLTIVSGTALSEAFDMTPFVGGQVYVPSTWTPGNVGFYTSDEFAGSYVVAKDDVGVPVQITTIATGSASAYFIPTELFPSRYVKLWSKSTTQATETSVNQATARAMKVVLK